MLQVVLLAQRAAVVEDGHPAGIGLEGDEDAADGHLTGLGALQGAVFRRHGGPDRQLVVDEFVDVDCHNFVKLGIFRGKSYRSASSRP